MKAIKAFAPYKLTSAALYKWCQKAVKNPERCMEVMQHWLAKDPASHAYESIGILPPFESDKPVHDLDGAAYLLCYQYNQRILPGAVRDEKLAKRVADLAEREGRDLTKTEYAQLRDEVEKELLPVAFIRRTHIPVFIYKGFMLICTTSVKRQEEIITHLSQFMAVREIDTEVHLIFTNDDVLPLMKKIAIDGSVDASNDNTFQAADAAVFKGSDKRTMRIKDRDISHKEVQQALVEGSYQVVELRCNYLNEDGEEMLTANVTEKFIFKGIKMGETIELKSAEDMHATFFIYAKQLLALTFDWIDVLGGEAAPDDEDEEL